MAIIVVLLGVLVVSAYATSGGSGSGTGVGADVSETRLGVGDCVRVVMISGSTPAPAPVACGTSGAYQVRAVVDTPRPCPTGTEAIARQKTTYCLARFG